MKISTFATIMAISTFSVESTTPYLGISLNAVVAACAGAYCSFSFGTKIEPRKRMFQLFVSAVLLGGFISAIIGAALTYLLPGVEQTEELQVGIAGIVSFLVPHVAPEIIERVRGFINGFKKEDK